MNRVLKTLILSLAVSATTLAPLAQAQADQRWRHHRAPVARHHDNSGLIAAGIVGLAVGAIIAGATAPREVRPAPIPVRPRPQPNYYPPAPASAGYDDGPRVIYADEYGYDGAPEPWTRDWFAYCRSRFRSFDPESGTYLGYDGRRHFCEAR